MSSTCTASMGAAPRRLLGACAMLMAILGVANAASGNAASVVGLAKCADCSRKNMNAETAFKGLTVAIKCKNSNGEYESKAVGKLDGSGGFSVPLTTDIHGADCLAQLHSAAGTPCPGQEPSRITPLAGDDTFVAIPGKTQQPTAGCASVTICSPMTMHFLDHFHKKSEAPKPKPEPEFQPSTPTYGSTTPTSNHPPATDTSNKNHDLHHFFDHFHKKPVPPKPKPEYQPPTTPAYGPPTTPTYGGSSTPTTPTPAGHDPTKFDHVHKGWHHFFDHFHKRPVPPEPKPQPQPQPQPEYQPPTPPSGSPAPPIYHPPASNH